MNKILDFPSDQFRFLGVCHACGWIGWLDWERLSDEMTIEALRTRVSCQHCGSQDCGIRIVYVGAGEYGYR